MTRYRGVRGRIVYARGPDEIIDIADGVLIYDVGGQIVACEPFERMDERYADVDVEHLKGRLIIPGLVDCHIHLPQLDQRGRFGATLMAWLNEHILPAEAAFDDPQVVDDVGRRFFKKLILNGTTTASIYSSIHEQATDRAFELAKVAGVRAIIGKVMMDQHSPPELIEETAASIESSLRLYEKWHGKEGGRLRYAFAPRFAPTCSLELWEEIGKQVQRTDAHVQSHIAETVKENDLVAEIFPGLKDYFSLFENTGVVGPRVVLGHAIHMTDDEYRRMGKSETRIAHCPTSNLFLKSGAMPMRRVEDAGIVYGLGTDVGAGISISLFSEMRHADYSQRDMHVSPIKSFYLATLGGACTLSMDDDIGSFEAGKRADFCVLDVKKIDYYYDLEALNTVDLLSLMVYRGDGDVVEATYIDGVKLDPDHLTNCSK